LCVVANMESAKTSVLKAAMNTKRRIPVLSYAGAVIFFAAAAVLLIRGLGDSLPPPDQTKRPSNYVTPDPKKSELEGFRHERNALSSQEGAEVVFTVDELVAIYESKGASAALESAKSITGKNRDSQVLFILSYIARIAPEWVAENLKESGLSATHQGFVVSDLMESWKDGAKALDWASRELTGDLRKTAVGRALRILIRSDPSAALAYLESMPPSGSRSQASADIFSTWGECDPKAAIAYATEYLPSDEMAPALSYIARSWARKNPSEAIEWLESVQEPELKVALIRDAVGGWYSSAPEDAVTWVNTITDLAFRKSILDQFAEIERNTIRCGAYDPSQPSAIAWKTKKVSEMNDSDLFIWAMQEREKFLLFVENAPPDINLKPLAGPAIIVMAEKEGIAAAFEFAKTFPEDARPEAMRAATIMWAGQDPSSAAAQLASIEFAARQPLAITLVEQWSRNDPAAAAGWVGSLQVSEQTPLIVPILRIWSDQDPKKAYEWIGSLPSGDARDAGISQMVNWERHSDPESLIPWVKLFSTPELRAENAQKLE
jgi:hypothetical protein